MKREDPPGGWCETHQVWDCAERGPCQPPLPSFAIVKGFGRCRVLNYNGNGYFTLLSPRDDRLFRHRDQLTFTNR